LQYYLLFLSHWFFSRGASLKLLSPKNLKLHKATATNNQIIGMRKLVSGSLIILLLSISLSVTVVDANPLPPSWMNPKMTITILSPKNGTDNALPVLVNFTAQCSAQFSFNSTGQDWLPAFYYVLDGQNMSSLGTNFTDTKLTATHPTDVNHYYDYSGQAYLTNLNVGSHSITVYYGVLVNVDSPTHQSIVYDQSWSATSQFSIQTPNSQPTQNPSMLPLASPSPTPSSTTSNSPTAPVATPTPTQTLPTDQPTVLVFNQQTLLAVASVIIIIAIASVLLVYIKRRKSKVT
jgi:hypothetical protein